jgi:hypothetical protein
VQPPTLLFLPGLAAAYLAWAGRLDWRQLLPGLVCLVIGATAVVALVYMGDPGLMQSANAQGGAIVLPAPTVPALLAMSRRYVPFLIAFPARELLFVFAAVTTGLVAWHWIRGMRPQLRALSSRQRDIVALALMLMLSLVGLGLFRYQQPGYGLALLGLLFLLGGAGLDALARALGAGVQTETAPRGGLDGRLWAAPIVVLACLLPAISELRHNAARGEGDGQSEAYAYVGDHWRPGDAWLNANIVAWIYAGHADPHFFYLCASSCGLGLMQGKNGYVNRFIGSPQVTTEGEVTRILDTYPRAWFVVKQSDWEDGQRMPPAIRRVISDRMQIVFKRNLATVFHSGSP